MSAPSIPQCGYVGHCRCEILVVRERGRRGGGSLRRRGPRRERCVLGPLNLGERGGAMTYSGMGEEAGGRCKMWALQDLSCGELWSCPVRAERGGARGGGRMASRRGERGGAAALGGTGDEAAAGLTLQHVGQRWRPRWGGGWLSAGGKGGASSGGPNAPLAAVGLGELGQPQASESSESSAQ
eukprot:6037100-Prymnesium_polylepis.1